MKSTILIIGCGYRGKRLARRLIAEGRRVRGLTRSADHAAELAKLGIEPVVGDVTRPESLRGICTGVSAVYHLMGSMSGNDEQLQKLHVDGTRNALEVLAGARLERYVYESSTAVYGQVDGEWITEDAPREPSSTIGRLRVQAENLLLDAFRSRALPLIILRPSSIYRPEGLINRKIRDGSYVLSADPEKLMNHIYVEDFLDVLVRALKQGKAGEAYNVTDDQPKTFATYINAIADLMGVQHPSVNWQALPPPERCADLIRQSNKRCSNAKLKADFGLTLRFPSYREGLAESARVGWAEQAL